MYYFRSVNRILSLNTLTMTNTTTSTRTYFMLVTGFLGSNPNSYASEFFNTIEDAKSYWQKEYKDRLKNDEFDEYWNNKPFCVKQVTETIIIDERTSEQIAESHVHYLENGWKFLLNNQWSNLYNSKQDCINAFIVRS